MIVYISVTYGAAQKETHSDRSGVSLLCTSDRAGLRLPPQKPHYSPRPETRKFVSQRRDGSQDRRLWSGHSLGL